ncbi:2-hydroxyglutaryl-CoA dehydratase [Clostridiaceae bacterium DONG20-135]|uniref:2-hydroxyglutaryl-CoA dehydratase n=1 Tax=Copranaerobaculum intestinale TaxID=2692629 RepID=A0A6N8U8F9_9FIRM|nr:2-hydroxyacyl-CoA dehydratase [Copranaerobaculum intestinale]MXQ74488.1 2-hydroxyglutaryl-CoA dehydratase [Copranaerobaculum intestinale]
MERVEFTKAMRKTHTILIPDMLPIHFKMIERVLRDEGYQVELLQTTGSKIAQEGLNHVHNDTCYPALLVIGQMIDALKSGKYDLDHVALAITQTGGGCRASNYLYLLRKALVQAGFENIPVISLNFSKMEKNSGFKLTLRLLIKLIYALIYGDMLMWIANQCLPYEAAKGTTMGVVDHWVAKLNTQFHSLRFLYISRNYKQMLTEFSMIKRSCVNKIKVGIVGEIYMKYAPLGNNNLVDFLLKENAEPVVSGVIDFGLYCLKNNQVDFSLYGIKKHVQPIAKLAISFITHCQSRMIKAIQKEGTFRAPGTFDSLLDAGEGFINKGAKMGEGWLLTSEMVELIHSGVQNIVCCQPFGCLPNHIVAKGMMRKIKNVYPTANIVAVDYDPGASIINQENRLKLMLANARLNERMAHGGTAEYADKKAHVYAYEPH